MANRPQVTIEFKPKGDKALVSAINKLAESMDKAENATKKIKNETKKLTPIQKSLKKQLDGAAAGMSKLRKNTKGGADGLKKFNQQGAFSVHHMRNMDASANSLKVSFSVLRSKLLLMSFGYTLLAGSVLKVVNLFGEQELAERRLSIALGFRSQALLDQATALQQQTRFGDEAIIGAQAMLAVFVKDEEQGSVMPKQARVL